MSSEKINWLFNLILSEIAITNKYVFDLETQRRYWGTLVVTGAIASFTLRDVGQLIALIVLGYGLSMLFDSTLLISRAKKIEDTFRGLILRPEFGLYTSDDDSTGKTFEMIGSLLDKRRNLYTLRGRRATLEGSKDLARIIDQSDLNLFFRSPKKKP